MQENELENLDNTNKLLEKKIKIEEEKQVSIKNELDILSKEIDDLKNRSYKLTESLGVPMLDYDVHNSCINFNNHNLIPESKIGYNEIPSWDEIVCKADEKIAEDIILEELLSNEEFNYCLEDVKRINNEFSQKTNIVNKKDLSFLMLATALQTARWIIIQNLMGDLGKTIDSSTRRSAKDGDSRKKKDTSSYHKSNKDKELNKSQKGYPNWKEILFGQYKRKDGGKTRWNCPYDAQEGAPDGFDDNGRGNHRVNTLGHDPILGWIFGTSNLMTCTISLSKKFSFDTYRVEYPYGVFAEKITMFRMFYEVYESIKKINLDYQQLYLRKLFI